MKHSTDLAVMGLLCAAIALPIAGCQLNVFDPLDSPGGSAQLLSAARACFDRADFQCAAENYAKLGSSSDQALAETVYLTLDRNGAGFGSFLKSFAKPGSGKVGRKITKLANFMTPYAGKQTRKDLITAYKNAKAIGNSKVRGLARFIGAMGIAAEQFAEDAGGDGSYDTADLVANSSACSASTCTATPASCAGPSGHNLTVGSFTSGGASDDLDTITDANLDSTVPTWHILNAAMIGARNALTELTGGVAAGGIAAEAVTFVDAILAANLALSAQVDACYRQTFLSQELGQL